MTKIKSIIIFLIFLFTIPLIGIVVSRTVSNGFETQYEKIIIDVVKKQRGVDISENKQALAQINLGKVCLDTARPNELNSICDINLYLGYLNFASWLTFIFTILFLTIIFILGRISLTNRNSLFYLFRPSLFLSQIFAAILVLANSGILVASLYFAESYYLEQVHIVLIGIVAPICGLVAISVIGHALTPIKEPETKIFGKLLPKENYPSLWKYINSLANNLGTTVPDNIIVGMDPTFFVTETKVKCLDGELRGKTLYISLPFCRLLSINELSAIIGHEMGHFIGEDTKWSQKFYPVYKGSIETIAMLNQHSNQNGLVQLSLLPSFLFMNYFLNSFSAAEKKIGRERELNADMVGVKVTNPTIMATALSKIHIYQQAWQITLSKMIEAISENKHIINLSMFFSSVCSLVPTELLKKEIQINTTVPHPTDTHPSLTSRLDAINISQNTINPNDLTAPCHECAIILIQNAEMLEQELSLLEHQKLIDLGIAKVNIESDTNKK